MCEHIVESLTKDLIPVSLIPNLTGKWLDFSWIVGKFKTEKSKELKYTTTAE